MTGTLVLDLSYPPAAFLYQATKPMVTIDGVEQPVEPWGNRSFDLVAGVHRIDVHVPYAFPRKAGKATLEVTVPSAGTVRVQYVAPTVTFAGGSLGAPGEQQSVGASAVQKANMVAIIAIVLIVIALFLFA